jgi:hypothetical protein
LKYLIGLDESNALSPEIEPQIRRLQPGEFNAVVFVCPPFAIFSHWRISMRFRIFAPNQQKAVTGLSQSINEH